MKSLIHRLLMMKVRPYYLYQCDLVKGSSHLRVDPMVGIEIIEALRGHTSGYAIPQFVIDAPGGRKIPINPEYIKEITPNEFVLKNFSGSTYKYPRLHSPSQKKFEISFSIKQTQSVRMGITTQRKEVSPLSLFILKTPGLISSLNSKIILSFVMERSGSNIKRGLKETIASFPLYDMLIDSQASPKVLKPVISIASSLILKVTFSSDTSAAR